MARRVAGLAALIGLACAGADERPRLAREMLEAHNAVRKSVRVKALSWSEKLASNAQQWADSLIRQGGFRHQPRNVYGENLFALMGNNPRGTAAEVVANWASEAAYYDYRSNLCHGVCGHYTQMVWRDTHEVGCAVARSTT